MKEQLKKPQDKNDMAQQQELLIAIHCQNLPGCHFQGRDGVRLGVQRGQTVIDDVPADAQEVTFTVSVRLGDNTKTGGLNLLGPFVFGTPDQRFIYLSWGERDGESWEMFRRAKLQLNHLTHHVVDQARRKGEPLHVSIDMTDEKGGPRCASLWPHHVNWQL